MPGERIKEETDFGVKRADKPLYFVWINRPFASLSQTNFWRIPKSCPKESLSPLSGFLILGYVDKRKVKKCRHKRS